MARTAKQGAMEEARILVNAVATTTLGREYVAWALMTGLFALYVTLGGDRFPSVLATGLFACMGLQFIHQA